MGDYDIKSIISNAYNISRQFYPQLKIPPNHENVNDKTEIILKRTGKEEIIAEMNVKTFESNNPVEEKEEDEFDETKSYNSSEIGSSIESYDSNGTSNA